MLLVQSNNGDILILRQPIIKDCELKDFLQEFTDSLTKNLFLATVLTIKYNSQNSISIKELGNFDRNKLSQIFSLTARAELFINNFDLDSFYNTVWKMSENGGFTLLPYLENLTLEKYMQLIEVHNFNVQKINREMEKRLKTKK